MSVALICRYGCAWVDGGGNEYPKSGDCRGVCGPYSELVDGKQYWDEASKQMHECAGLVGYCEENDCAAMFFGNSCETMREWGYRVGCCSDTDDHGDDDKGEGEWCVKTEANTGYDCHAAFKQCPDPDPADCRSYCDDEQVVELFCFVFAR